MDIKHVTKLANIDDFKSVIGSCRFSAFNNNLAQTRILTSHVL